jgi:hypothetical protein
LPRYLKCQFCKERVPFEQKDEMVIDVVVSVTNKEYKKYIHRKCYPAYLKHKEFIEQENRERDELNKVVMEIHGLMVSPNKSWWEMVQDLRNGTNRYEKFWKKRYKQGVPYRVVKEAYLLAKNDIEWAKLNKKFERVEQELKYGLAIAVNRLNDAYRKLKMEEEVEKKQRAIEHTEIELYENARKIEYKRQDSDDLSDILGDD